MRLRTDGVNAIAHRAMSPARARPRGPRLSWLLRASLIAAAHICISAVHVAAQATIPDEAVTAAEALQVAESWRMPLTLATHPLLANVAGRTTALAGMRSLHFSGQQEEEQFRMLFPLIGAAAGAGIGYLYGKRDSSADDYVPAGLFSIPVGALAGFVVGIVAEDIRSQMKDDADRRR
jgi:hypothetical protein